MEITAKEFFRVALLAKNIEEGTTTTKDMDTLKILVGHTDLSWAHLENVITYSVAQLEHCIGMEIPIAKLPNS